MPPTSSVTGNSSCYILRCLSLGNGCVVVGVGVGVGVVLVVSVHGVAMGLLVVQPSAVRIFIILSHPLSEVSASSE